MPTCKFNVSVEQYLRLSDAAEKLGWVWNDDPTDRSVVASDWWPRSIGKVIELGIRELEIEADRHVNDGIPA